MEKEFEGSKVEISTRPSIDAARAHIQAFANRHKVIFQDKGEVGFGRSCVGLESGEKYIDYNPYSSGNYEPIPGFQGDFLPEGVPDAYHKHDCIAVLVSGDQYDEAIQQLCIWVKYLESLNVEIVQYATGATGVQAMFSGVFGKAVRIPAEVTP